MAKRTGPHARTSGQGPRQRHRCPQRRRDRPRRDAARPARSTGQKQHPNLGGQPGRRQPTARPQHAQLASEWRSTPAVLYWSNTNTSAITPADLDGSNAQDLVPVERRSWHRGLAVDASHVYWASYAAGSAPGTICGPTSERQQPPGHRHCSGHSVRDRGRRQPHLLDQQRRRHHLASQPRRHHPPVHRPRRGPAQPLCADDRRQPPVLDQPQPEHGQACQPGRHQPPDPRPRPEPPAGDRGRRPLRLLVQPRGPELARSAGPTWRTAPTRRSSSPTPPARS